MHGGPARNGSAAGSHPTKYFGDIGARPGFSAGLWIVGLMFENAAQPRRNLPMRKGNTESALRAARSWQRGVDDPAGVESTNCSGEQAWDNAERNHVPPQANSKFLANLAGVFGHARDAAWCCHRSDPQTLIGQQRMASRWPSRCGLVCANRSRRRMGRNAQSIRPDKKLIGNIKIIKPCPMCCPPTRVNSDARQ